VISAGTETPWRLARLTRPAQYQAVLRARQRRDSRYFRIQYLSAPDAGDSARLGITVSKRVDKRAVGRNRIKRQIRDSFRAVRRQLPAMDYVVVAKSEAAQASQADLAADLARLWQPLCERELPPKAGEVTMPDSQNAISSTSSHRSS
jgi:ribonuclease P protein component